MPLADAERGVALRQQHLGQEAVFLGHHAVVAGKSGGHFLDDADAVGVVIAAGEQACACRGTDCRGVKVAETQSTCGEPVERGRADVRAKASELREADVVEQEHEHVGRAGLGALRQRPCGLRGSGGAANLSGEGCAFGIGLQVFQWDSVACRWGARDSGRRRRRCRPYSIRQASSNASRGLRGLTELGSP